MHPPRAHRLRAWLADSLRAHALRFERPLAPEYADAVGNRMLLAFVAVALGLFLGLRHLLGAAGAAALPTARTGFVLILLAAFAGAQRAGVRAPFATVGLHPWAQWTRRERLYLLQTAPLAALAFAVVFRAPLLALVAQHGVRGFVLFSLLTGLAWGMVQEFFYRGWLQTELTRRFGALRALLAANLAFTFGPLHADLLAAGRWGSLAAVFGIGLLFGLLYRRSGNLWIPALLHGLWPPNMA